MVVRGIWIGVVLIVSGACGKSEGTKQGAPTAAPVAGSAAPSTPPAPAAAPVEPPPAAASAAPPADPAQAGSNGPADKPVAVSTKAEAEELDRAIAPYSEQARKAYPAAKKRFLAGLPAGDKFAVATKLHSPGKVETVFVVVQRIEGNKITGKLDSVGVVTGYKAGDSYTLPETDLVDWAIVHPDGSEEGNVVGKFLDTWKPSQHP